MLVIKSLMAKSQGRCRGETDQHLKAGLPISYYIFDMTNAPMVLRRNGARQTLDRRFMCYCCVVILGPRELEHLILHLGLADGPGFHLLG